MSSLPPDSWCELALDEVAEVLDFEREPVNATEREARLRACPDGPRYAYYGATGQVGWIDEFRSEGRRVLLGEDGAPFLDLQRDKAYLAQERFWVNNHAHVLRGLPGVCDDRFLCHQLNAIDYHGHVTGSTRLKLTSRAMCSMALRLAPYREQQRIADKLDELLGGNVAATEDLGNAKRKLALYRQSLLKSAVEGTLTAEWRISNPGAESGGALLERIGAGCPPLSGDADLPETPSSWSWAPLGALGEITSGVAKGSKVRPGEALREVPYLRVANVQRGYLDLSEVKSIAATERDIRDLSLQPGDVLFNEGGDRDKLGRGWVWNGEIETCIHQNHVFRLRPRHPDLQSEFISHHSNSFGRRWFEAAGKQTTNLASINLGILRRFPVPVPPAEEQKVIVERLRAELDAVAASESAVEHGLRMAAAQRQNILRAAFCGQLVPQDPNDEPASVLLERIRAQRSASADKPVARRPRKAKIVA